MVLEPEDVEEDLAKARGSLVAPMDSRYSRKKASSGVRRSWFRV